MIIEITMEKTQRTTKKFDVTEEQLKDLKYEIIQFLDELEKKIDSDDCEYDYTVKDENGKTIINWG